GSSDACGIAELALDRLSFGCADVGSNPVVLTVTDNNDNSATCSATVTVEDKIVPQTVCQDITISLDAAGNASITPAQIDNGSSDACGIAELVLDRLSFGCADVGSNPVVLTVTDNNDNSASCSANVTVEDKIVPQTVCQDITVSLDAAGNAFITPAQIDNGSSDACGIAELALDRLSFGCADVGSNPVVLTVTDNNDNSASCSATVTVEDKIAPQAVCKDIDVYLDPNGTASITPSEIDGGSFDACGITLRATPLNFTSADLGPNSIDLTVIDNNDNSASCTATVTILKRPTILTYQGELEVQYSDPVQLEANLKDELSGLPISNKLIVFTLGNQTVSALTDGTGKASSILVVTQPPSVLGNNYIVRASFEGDDVYLGDEDADNFTVLQENARADFTGSLFVSTAGNNSTEATVLLSATIRDISAVPADPATDGYPGQIVNAKVNFINRDNGQPINPVPLSVSALNATTGTVLYNWNVDIGNADAEDFSVGIQVLNYYTGNNSEDDVVITVYQPQNDFVTGGGYIVLSSDSEGILKGSPGTRSNFGFNIKFNPAGTKLQGRVRVLTRRMEQDGVLHTYQIKGNKMSSLSIDPITGYALFYGKANVQDVTDPDNPVTVAGNLIFKIEMTDNGEPGNTDLIGMDLYSNKGSLWYSSKWNGVETVMQTLAGGNLKVQAGKTTRNSNGKTSNLGSTPEGPPTPSNSLVSGNTQISKSDLQVFPNPASTTFNIRLFKAQPGMVIRIVNELGQIVWTEKVRSADTADFRIDLLDQRFKSGVYFVTITSDGKQVTKKLIINNR
ncbi:T9SS type A sorting domain-containing protein, partial [Flavilitoribacter nigricans]